MAVVGKEVSELRVTAGQRKIRRGGLHLKSDISNQSCLKSQTSKNHSKCH